MSNDSHELNSQINFGERTSHVGLYKETLPHLDAK